jgi:thiamine-monophosphate kinase
MTGQPPPDRAPLTVGEAGEREIIALVRARVPPPPAHVVLGIGDDAAVVEPARNHLEVLTTDAAIEGVHFDRRYVDAGSIGHRALAANLSDLAAMGATPRAALLSLALPQALPLAELDALLRGLLDLAAAHRLPLVGGNVTRSPGPLVVDVTLTGAVKRRKVLTRGGGRPGDELYVTGTVGGAAAGLAWLQRQAGAAAPTTSDDAIGDAVARFLRPEPRLRFGVIAGRTRAASAAIDLSDGLADAVRQVAEASGTGALVEAEACPVHPAGRAVFGPAPEAVLRSALTGGEDYELLLAVPRRATRRLAAAARLARLAVTRIGALTPDPAVRLRVDGHEVALPVGFEHFR